MIVIHACVDDGDLDVFRTFGDFPGSESADVFSSYTAREPAARVFTIVIKAPLLSELSVAVECVVSVVFFNVEYAWH